MFPTVMNSLSVGVFSCERIAVQFPLLWRKILLRRGQRKVRLSEGRPILVTFHLSLVLLGATNVFSELIYPLLIKIAELCFDRGTQREYGSKPLKHSIVKRMLVFKR